MKIGIMGMGEIGNANYNYLKSLGFDVPWYDPVLKDSFDLPVCNAYIICPSSDKIIEACELIKKIDIAPLLLIESTARIGTSKKIYELFEGKARVVYCPQRFWAKDPQGRGVRRFRLISAFTQSDLAEGIIYYKKLFNIPVYPVSSPEVAEVAKYVENAYRGVQIAFAQELKIYCDDEGIDFDEVREGIMTATPDMHYLPKAMDGIGGHCLPMAMDWLRNEMALVDTAIIANNLYKDYIEGEE